MAKLLDKLHAEFTKSRACRSQDNALVEGRARWLRAVVRKLIGYGYIAGARRSESALEMVQRLPFDV